MNRNGRKCPSYTTPILIDAHPMDEFRDDNKERKKERKQRPPQTFAEVASENGFLIKDTIRAGVRIRL